jgi:hypothetical protein
MADLFIDITFPISEREQFKIDTNVKDDKIADVISEFLRSQIGAGRDENEPHVREVYRIRLELDLADDSFTTYSDTGNKGLRDGILMEVVQKLTEAN